MDDDQQFCLRWNNHQSTLISVFDTLLENGTLVDCTLAAEGKFLKAHKVVLSACSPYFAALLSQQYDKHPIFILKDVKFQELRAMMDYMYRGEVNISQDQLAALLKAAESLQIKGLSDSRGSGSGGSGGSSSQKADTSTKLHGSVPAAKQTSTGLTIEQKRPRIEKHPATIDMEPDVSDSREGSTSPNSRKRKKVRRRSIETNNIGDNHDQHSNSSSHSMPHAASSTHSTSMPTITSATSSASVLNVTKKTDHHQSHDSKGDIERDVDDNGDDGTDGGDGHHQQPQIIHARGGKQAGMDSDSSGQQAMSIAGSAAAKDKMEHSTHQEMLLEPKNEYDESNEGNVEDLTLDDEELLDDLEQAGPSHGGEGSSQGYAQWQIERSQDEVFMGGQDSTGQHRDAQDVKTSVTFGEVLSGCLLENENIVVTQKNDKFVLLEINTPSTEKRKDDGGKEGKRAVITDISDAKKVVQEQQQKSASKPIAVTTNTTSVVTTVVTVPPKVTTKNHPRIKYSMKQPVPVSLHKSLNKFELLNFSLSRKFGNKLTGETTTVLSGAGAGIVTSTGYGNTSVGGGSTLSVVETEIAKVPASIIIQAPNSNKSASNINEDLQSSIMGDLSNYEIDDIELPDGTQIGFSDSTDSMDRDASRADYESRSADDNTKFAYIEGRSLQNYDFSQSDSNDDINRQYVCRHCGKKYRWKSTLRRHENVECGGKEPMHQCPHCAYRAKQRGNLGVHIRKHHSDMPQLETRRKNRSS